MKKDKIQRMTERNANILKLYKTNSYSYNVLARIFKISPQRIAQIIKTQREMEEMLEGVKF